MKKAPATPRAPRADGRTIPRTKHTRAIVALEPGAEPLIVPARLATSARLMASRWGAKLGRKYRCNLIPDGSGRMEIYREA